MNRAQRRANKSSTAMYKEISLPPILDEYTVFNPIQELILKIKSDGLEYKDGEGFVMLDTNRKWVPVTAILSGWVYTWRRIQEELIDEYPAFSTLDLKPMKHTLAKLHEEKLLSKTLIANLDSLYSQIRLLFRTTDRRKIANVAKRAMWEIDNNEMKKFSSQ